MAGKVFTKGAEGGQKNPKKYDYVIHAMDECIP
jgi:hypothetical protein